MRSIVLSPLCLALLWQAAAADEGPWVPTSANKQPAPAASCPVQLGRPQPLITNWTPGESPPAPQSRPEPAPSTSFFDPPPIIRAQMPDSAPPPPPPPAGSASPFPGGAPGGEEAYNCGVVANPTAGSGTGSGTVGGFFEKAWDNTKKFFSDAPGSLGGVFQGRNLFQSDHKFDSFISPVTNPFLFEDPRALTEIRPIFMWQQTPSQNPVFRGGDNFFFGFQASLAVTDWFSFVINRFGENWMETSDPAVGSHVGFSEIWLGPKVTFIRNDRTGTLMAGGLTFEIPAGPDKVFQGVGTLGIAPYFSFAQNFLRSFPYGSFNFMNTTGYSFSTTNQRTEFFYSSFHLDFDVGNLHKIYPLVEVNWIAYTRNGRFNSIEGMGGGDLFNFGSAYAGHDEFSVALGARYVFSNHIQFGTGLQWGLLNNTHHLDGFRWTIDVIFRY